MPWGVPNTVSTESGSKQKREWIFVSDNCEALFAVYKNGIIGESYNIGSGKNLRNIERGFARDGCWCEAIVEETVTTVVL